MLRKSLIRQSFFGHGLLLMVPAATTKAEVYSSSNEITAVVPLLLKRQFNDTLKAVPADTFAVRTFTAPKIQLNKNASQFAKSFWKKEDEFLQKMKGRSPSYFTSIESVFCRYDVPQQLKYLAIVESELRPTAMSRVGARGLWQFMPGTARELGLKVSGKYDDRIHTYRSTVAAAKYLKALYKEFGDWLLVLAAYNGGPGTVYKAIKKAGSKNFWVLQQYLPQESRGHVKRFISIHYFFDGEGSIATQTKAEAKAYLKDVKDYKASMALTQISKDTVDLVSVSLNVQ